MRDWYGMEMKVRKWARKPMSTLTTIVVGTLAVFSFGLMIFLSM